MRFSRLHRALGALVIVLGVSLSLVATAAAQETAPPIEIEFLEPTDGEDVVVSQNFVAKVNIVATGGTQPFNTMDATITIDTGAEIGQGTGLKTDTEEIALDDWTYAYDKDQWKKGLEWPLHCLAEGTTTITVTVERGEAVVATSSVTVEQYPGHPDLDVTIKKPTKDKFHESESFSVMAYVCNDGGEPAIDVEAAISLPGIAELVDGESARKFLGDIPADQCHEAMWTVHAKEAGSGSLSVTATGRDDVTGDDLASASASYDLYVVKPQELDVKITNVYADFEYENGERFRVDWVDEVGKSMRYTVTGKVENVGYYFIEHLHTSISVDPPAVEGGAEVISGWVDYDSDGDGTLDATAYWTPGEPDIDLPPDFQLNQHDTFEVTWVLHCEGPAEVMEEQLVDIDISAIGETECQEDRWNHDTYQVLQKDLVVLITDAPTSPINHDWPRSAGRRFWITATVCNWNYDEYQAIGMKADLVWDPMDGADPIQPGNVTIQDLGDIGYGYCYEDVGWLMECEGPDDVDFTVEGYGHTSPGGILQNDDQVTVVQEYKAHLFAEILEPLPNHWYGYSDDVPLEVEVSNSGEATAEDVAVEVEIVGNADYGGMTDFTIDFGDIKGNSSATRERTLHCNGPCEVTIYVEPTGTDANAKANPLEDDDAIPDDNLEGTNVTIKQLPLKATIDQFPNEVETGSTFGVHALVWNTYDQADCGPECFESYVYDVEAEIFIDGPAELAPGESKTKMIDVITPDDDSKTPQHAEWTLKCTGPGTVQVYVVFGTSTKPGYPDEDLGYTVDTKTEWVAIKQTPRLTGYNLQLCKDWNYMSLPLIPTSTDIGEVLDSVYGNVVDVWAYDAEMDKWLVHVPGMSPSQYDYAGLTELTEMKDGLGYIIRMNYPDILKGEGYEDPPGEFPQEPLEYDLVEGWNFIGFKTRDFTDDGTIDAGDVITAGAYLENLNACVGGGCRDEIVGDEARYLYTYQCGYPGYWASVTNDRDNLGIGQGYWLRASLADLSIVPPVSDY